MNKFPITFWRNAVLERHVCTACGYVEQYVKNPDDRAAIAEKWSRPQPM